MNCPKCGTINNEGAMICMRCGNSLIVSSIKPSDNNLNMQNSINNNVQQPQVTSPQTVNVYQTPNNSINNVSVSQPNVAQPEYNTNKPNKSNGYIKYIIIAILAVALIVGGFFLIKNFFGNSKEGEKFASIFDPNNLIAVKNNGKYGYINSEGKTLIEPKYDKAGDFQGGYAVVYNPESDGNSYQIIDKNGNVKLSSPSSYGIKYYSDYEIWVVDGGLYDSKFSRISPIDLVVEYEGNGYLTFTSSLTDESGIMDYKGKIVFKWNETSIYADIVENDYNQDELLAVVESYYPSDREVVVSLKTGNILFELEDVDNNYLSEDGNGIFYYYNMSEENGYSNKTWLYFYNNQLAYKITDQVYDLTVYDYNNGILELNYGYDYEDKGKEKRYYYYDLKNDTLLTEKPKKSYPSNINIDLSESRNEYKKISCSGQYGVIRGDKVVVPCEYDSVEYFSDNLFKYIESKGKALVLIEKDEKIGLFNMKNKKIVTTFDSDDISDYDNSTFIKITLYESDGETISGYIVYNLLSGKSMTFVKSDDYEFNIYSNYVTVKKDNKKIYYNTNFKEIYVEDL